MGPILALGFLALAVLLHYLRSRVSLTRRRPPLPPGPKGLPLLGNLLDLPPDYSWLTYAKWRATYGDIIYLDTPASPTIIVNSAEAAMELFERRSINYSDRPGELMTV